MILLTGDIHGDITRIMDIPDDNMTKEDLVIVAGDFGVFWSAWNDGAIALANLQQLSTKRFTTCFVDGNHENFVLINNMIVERDADWNDGKVDIMPYGIIHLKRGEVYLIEGKVIGTLGGADSVDRALRTENLDWWPDEQVSSLDQANLYHNAERFGGYIDIMITHCAPDDAINALCLLTGHTRIYTPSEAIMGEIAANVRIDKWYFGHYHMNKHDNKYRCLYEDIVEI